MDDYYVYALTDPRLAGTDAIFYIGKGTGARPDAHELETGETAKVQRIRDITTAGESYRVSFVSIRGQLTMDEPTAFAVEASLIWALRNQLTNAVAGHGFGLEPWEALDIVANARDVELQPDDNAVLVWATGIRGGRDIAGSFIAPDDADLWENARGYWIFGKGIREKLAHALDIHVPVALIVLSHGKRGKHNIVNGVFDISAWATDDNGKVYFERESPATEDDTIADLRERILGQQLTVSGRPMVSPGRWTSRQALRDQGLEMMPKTWGIHFTD